MGMKEFNSELQIGKQLLFPVKVRFYFDSSSCFGSCFWFTRHGCVALIITLIYGGI